MAQTSNMYSGKVTGSGVPLTQQAGLLNANGSVNINALVSQMVSRDIWWYYYTLKLAAGATLAASYSLFNAASGSPDPYPLSGTPVLTHVETNMPSTASNGFSSPRDLIVDQIGFYFLPGGCGASGSAVGTQANVNDMEAFCQYSYFEWKIIDKVFAEGKLEFQPAGIGFNGYSTVANTNVVTLGMANPHSVNRMNSFSKYLAPLMPWSVTIYFPSGSGPAGSAAALLTQAQGGNGLWLLAFLRGLTDRAVQ
jgi:hypothetical protein